MAHTYASVAQFNDWLRDAGSTTFASESALIIGRKLSVLEAVSRTIDAFCHRSLFGSGFGPRTGTNRYDGSGRSTLYLADDLLSLTSVSERTAIGGTATTLTEETDFILAPYDSSPKRLLIGEGSAGTRTFATGHRRIEIVGSWGYADTRITATATGNAIAGTTTNSVTVSAATECSPGQTLLIDDEQLYIRSIATTTLTVERGANGTTAATHGAASAIDIYTYHPRVVACQQDVALLRWKRRDAGSDATDGGGGAMPQIRPNRDELSTLHSHLSGLRAVLWT